MDHDRTARPNAIPWPPILYGGGALLAVLLHQAAPIPTRWLGTPPLQHVGEAMILAGLALDLWAMATMWRAKANILPHRAATALVTHGPFAFSRNPIYLGNTILLLGAGLSAVAQLVVVAIRRRAEIRPALALAFAAHLAIAVLLALAGGLASRLGPGMLLLFVAYAALAAFVHLLVCGLASMHTGWLPALALAMIALTIGLLIGFPPAALCLVTGFTAATGPAFAAFGHALATGHILREGTTEAFQQDGQRQQRRSALLAAAIAVAVVWLSHAALFADGRVPPMDHVYAIAIRAGTAPDVFIRMLPWAIAGAALQLAGGPTRQLGLLFATGLMLLNPAAGWALLAGLACRDFARRRLPAATPQDLRSFAGGAIAGEALYGLYDSTWRLIAGRR